MAIVVRGGRWMATVSVATTTAPATTSEKVENASSTRASPTGQRRRSHSPAQPSPPAITSAVNSQVAGMVDESRRPPITSSPKIVAARNSHVSTTQSRGRRRGRLGVRAAVAMVVAGAFILGAYRPGRLVPPPARGIDTEVAAAGTSVGRGGRSPRPIRRHGPGARVGACANRSSSSGS